MNKSLLSTIAAVLLFATFGFAVMGVSPTSIAWAQQYQPAINEDGWRRKAVTTTDGATLYEASSGEAGRPAELMKVYFLFEGEENGRIPAALDSGVDKPTLWLEEGSFLEWNSIQMVDFAPQGGRALNKVYDSADFALDFGANGASLACSEIGEEPNALQGPKNYNMLIPVFESQRDRANVAYQGGFVRVVGDQVLEVAPQPQNGSSADTTQRSAEIGYDLVLVIDSTASMGEYFEPTVTAVRDFVTFLQNESQGEISTALRIGLLFYQDRKSGTDCNLNYLTKWRVLIGDATGPESIDQAVEALSKEQATECSSDEPQEAVLDALNRALLDTKWNDNTFRVVTLIGNGPPHGDDEFKNPQKFTIDDIHKIADERNVRFLSFRLASDGEDTSAFQRIAVGRSDSNVVGRFRSVSTDNPSALTQALAQSLRAEWIELVKGAQAAVAQGVTRNQLQNDPTIAASLGIEQRNVPIILAVLPDSYTGSTNDSFTRGWVAQKVEEKKAVEEYLFIKRFSARALQRFLEALGDGMIEGSNDPGDVFVDTLRKTIAEQLNQEPDELFGGGDTISDMLRKASLLPFDTGLLAFTPDEPLTWKPEDYERIATLILEKSEQLDDFVQIPTNIRTFGDSKYLFVPKDLFP